MVEEVVWKWSGHRTKHCGSCFNNLNKQVEIGSTTSLKAEKFGLKPKINPIESIKFSDKVKLICMLVFVDTGTSH